MLILGRVCKALSLMPSNTSLLAVGNGLEFSGVFLCTLQEIAKRKLPDTNATKLESACKMVEGTARSLGLVVVD